MSKPDEFANGRVHAEVAVADSRVCFITNANLTGYAMERNIKAGIIVSGGPIPRALDEHLRALVNIRGVSPYEPLALPIPDAPSLRLV